MTRTPKTTRVELPETVNVNLTHEQKAKLHDAAEKKGLPLATFIRMAALDFVEGIAESE